MSLRSKKIKIIQILTFAMCKKDIKLMMTIKNKKIIFEN